MNGFEITITEPAVPWLVFVIVMAIVVAYLVGRFSFADRLTLIRTAASVSLFFGGLFLLAAVSLVLVACVSGSINALLAVIPGAFGVILLLLAFAIADNS